jgi:hypothetical protein
VLSGAGDCLFVRLRPTRPRVAETPSPPLHSTCKQFPQPEYVSTPPSTSGPSEFTVTHKPAVGKNWTLNVGALIECEPTRILLSHPSVFLMPPERDPDALSVQVLLHYFTSSSRDGKPCESATNCDRITRRIPLSFDQESQQVAGVFYPDASSNLYYVELLVSWSVCLLCYSMSNVLSMRTTTLP